MTERLITENQEELKTPAPNVGGNLCAKLYSSFEALPAHYSSLFEGSSTPYFDSSLPWFQNLFHNGLAPHCRLRIYGLEANNQQGTALAALPMMYEVHERGRLKPRTLLGLSNYYTSLFAPVVHPAIPSSKLSDALVRALCSDTPQWDVVNLRPLAKESPEFAGLLKSFRRFGWSTQTYFCFGNWYYPVNGRSYAEFLEGLKSSVRNIARSKNKKLERTGRAHIEINTGPRGLDSAIEAYNKIYAASWKVPEPYPLFVPGLIRTCAEMGWLRLGVAYVDGEPAAAQLWIVYKNTASIYKIAYDQKYKELSVGSYLTMRMMEQVIDVDRVREVDYLSGDDRYKSDWMSHRRERWGILAMNPHTTMGKLAILRHIGGRAVKDAARAVVRRFRS